MVILSVMSLPVAVIITDSQFSFAHVLDDIVYTEETVFTEHFVSIVNTNIQALAFLWLVAAVAVTMQMVCAKMLTMPCYNREMEKASAKFTNSDFSVVAKPLDVTFCKQHLQVLATVMISLDEKFLTFQARQYIDDLVWLGSEREVTEVVDDITSRHLIVPDADKPLSVFFLSGDQLTICKLHDVCVVEVKI
jgi:hypothetical protein